MFEYKTTINIHENQRECGKYRSRIINEFLMKHEIHCCFSNPSLQQ